MQIKYSGIWLLCVGCVCQCVCALQMCVCHQHRRLLLLLLLDYHPLAPLNTQFSAADVPTSSVVFHRTAATEQRQPALRTGSYSLFSGAISRAAISNRRRITHTAQHTLCAALMTNSVATLTAADAVVSVSSRSPEPPPLLLLHNWPH